MSRNLDGEMRVLLGAYLADSVVVSNFRVLQVCTVLLNNVKRRHTAICRDYIKVAVLM